MKSNDGPIPVSNKPKVVNVPPILKSKEVITLTPEEYLTNFSQSNVLRQINGKLVDVPRQIKRIVMKKNKIFPIPHVSRHHHLRCYKTN